MSKGRKPQLVTDGKFAALPLYDDPQSIHFARANALRPGDDLSADELKVWDRVAPHLAMLGRLKPHFVDALAEYCRVVRRLADARKYLDESEWTYITSGRNGQQFKSRPEVAQLNDDWRKWRSLVGEFGLAPAAERGMQSGQGDLFDDFDAF
jgi:Phage terminase, small subunit.